MTDKPLSLDHDQLRRRAAPAFEEVARAVLQALDRRIGTVRRADGWPTDEEHDRSFVEWLRPKQEETLDLIRQLSLVHQDVGDGLLQMERRVKAVDWGVADDMRPRDVPYYQVRDR